MPSPPHTSDRLDGLPDELILRIINLQVDDRVGTSDGNLPLCLQRYTGLQRLEMVFPDNRAPWSWPVARPGPDDLSTGTADDDDLVPPFSWPSLHTAIIDWGGHPPPIGLLHTLDGSSGLQHLHVRADRPTALDLVAKLENLTYLGLKLGLTLLEPGLLGALCRLTRLQTLVLQLPDSIGQSAVGTFAVADSAVLALIQPLRELRKLECRGLPWRFNNTARLRRAICRTLPHIRPENIYLGGM
ncbi:hypothetical protein CPLU01_15062 [Colletotrichum plurivorum]|uniref:F-box domain-containing protein n=1 Tax=Colletotrichum plurivorum TaxID=2175906 RepID=A0A8H6MWI4_9PEZI|nr:hypothetical protein CPLU01_15062 [Colletotrichum plurivorum]